ncbi:hypothetical protein ACI1US_01150 [Leucobacter sp. BZR 635]
MTYVFREETLTQAIAALRLGASLIITAPAGSGRTSFLGALAELLSDAAIPSLTFRAADIHTPEQVADAPIGTVALIDAFEQAGPHLLAGVRGRIAASSPCVVVVDPSNQDSPLAAALSELDLESDSGRTLLDAFHSIDLRPLAPGEIERLIHARSDFTIDATVAAAIVELAKGRPGWALDLLKLAREGGLVTFPRPNVARDQFLERSSTALSSVARVVGAVPPEVASAAVTLAAVEPMDLAGIEDLVGTATAAVLIRRGVLLQDQNRALLYVPRVMAAALAGDASPSHVDRFELALQRRLLTKAALGFPLTESEALFCSRAFPEGSSEAGPLPHEQRAALVQHSIAKLAVFGEEGLARSLLLRAGGGHVAGDGLAHAAVLSTLVGAGAGLSALERLPATQDPPALLARAYLRSRLNELAPSGADPFAASTEPSPASDDVRIVLSLWNTRTPDSLDSGHLRHLASTTPDSHVGLLATTLADLEDVWAGHVPAASWLSGDRPLPTSSAYSVEQLQHVASAMLLAQCLAALLAGQFHARIDEFQELAARGPLREYHVRWMRHFSAAATALACGDGPRAVTEWERFLACAPRIIPLRLQHRLDETHATLLSVVTREHVIPSRAGPLSDIVHYLACADRLRPEQQPPPSAEQREPTLPLLRLRAAHLRAAAAENPLELVRIAEQLRALEKWAPAAAAFGQARDIYLRRRSVGGAQLCDEHLQWVEARVSQLMPWYRQGTLPTGGYTPLTPRERETAALAATGLSNQQIALRLHCSVRTVESHIAQARAKLGAVSRRDLAGFALLRAG